MSYQRIKTEAEWLEARNECITATEVPVLFGLNKFNTPKRMFEEKKHKTFTGNAYTFLGQYLEPMVVGVTNKLLGSSFVLADSEEGKLFCMHDEINMSATPDALTDTQFLECKTTSPKNITYWRQDAPKNYLMQLQVQMICGDKDSGYLAVMGTNLVQTSPELKLDFLIYEVKRNKELEELIIKEVQRFWECIKEGEQYRVDSKNKKTSIKLLEENSDLIICRTKE